MTETEEHQETWVDEMDAPLHVRVVDLDSITPESVKAELAEKYMIAVPSRRLIYRTKELSAKRKILMNMVYKGEISVDLTAYGEGAGLIFYNTKPEVD